MSPVKNFKDMMLFKDYSILIQEQSLYKYFKKKLIISILYTVSN